VSALWRWRSWVLVLLLVGPVLAYVGLGMLWLWQRGWVACTVAAVLWLLAGGAFSILAARWTKTARPLLPPLDWDSPQLFSPLDRAAWKLVQEEAEQGETLSYEVLLGFDTYIGTGRTLFRRLSGHYHPFATEPAEDVPLVELMTALELAAEDLSGLCRQVPGGDLISLSHWRKAVQVAGYINRANDLYSFVLPFLNPVTGLTRLGTREWIVKPAWKSMQQNVLRWFYEAYVNRLGMHLIELMSGRLAIGAHHYRRLTKRPRVGSIGLLDEELKPLAIVVAGAQGSGKSRLIAMIKEACSGQMNLIKARVAPLGLEPSLLDRLKDARFIESPGYPPTGAAESRRTRAQRAAALAAAAECDLFILVVNGASPDHSTDVAFAQAWDRWFQEHPHHELPPALVVVTGIDRAEFGVGWKTAAHAPPGPELRESLVRAQFDSLRSLLPITFHDYSAVGLGDESPAAVIEQIVPALSPLLLKAERAALLRRLHEVAGRSRVGRLAQQIGQHGRSLWGSFKARRKQGSTQR
jgi:predicted GTPase